MINKERINAISLQCKARIIAEIGADHGFITKNLFETNKIDFAYCTDISAKCLDKARKNLSMFNGKVEFLVGNGLDVFSCNIMEKRKPQEIIIAGMGGKEIINILSSKNAKYFDVFILQPQKNIVQVRQFLIDNNFYIEKDVIAKEKKMFYNILRVVRTGNKDSLTPLELEFGRTNIKERGKDFLLYIKREIKKCREILEVYQIDEISCRLKRLENLMQGE